MNFLFEPWPWYVAGPLISLTLFLYFYFGKNFGVSGNFEIMCSIMGAGKFSDYFKKDWKTRDYTLIFVGGLIIGGFIASNFLILDSTIDLSPKTVKDLANLGFMDAGKSYLPKELYGKDVLFSLKGFLILMGSGFLIGFGTRYAGGCTSGHAITGLSSLQRPSLFATIGFFIGGLLMTWIFFPLIFG